jgi:TolA-binding protein
MVATKTAFSTLLAGIALSAMLGVSAHAQVPIHTGPVGTNPAKPRLEPCWQVAGVSKAAIQERHSLERQAHSEVESVCANSSLSAQQKREQIQQIRQREKQEVEGIISPSQQEAMKSCQASRQGAGHGAHAGGGHGGPCGEMSGGNHGTSGTKGHPMEEDDPDETAKPD